MTIPESNRSTSDSTLLREHAFRGCPCSGLSLASWQTLMSNLTRGVKEARCSLSMIFAQMGALWTQAFTDLPLVEAKESRTNRKTGRPNLIQCTYWEELHSPHEGTKPQPVTQLKI